MVGVDTIDFRVADYGYFNIMPRQQDDVTTLNNYLSKRQSL